MMDLVTPPTLWDGIMNIYEQIKWVDNAYVLKNQDNVNNVLILRTIRESVTQLLSPIHTVD
jgi:hypothetical protein